MQDLLRVHVLQGQDHLGKELQDLLVSTNKTVNAGKIRSNNNNNSSICKAQNCVPRDYSKI